MGHNSSLSTSIHSDSRGNARTKHFLYLQQHIVAISFCAYWYMNAYPIQWLIILYIHWKCGRQVYSANFCDAHGSHCTSDSAYVADQCQLRSPRAFCDSIAWVPWFQLAMDDHYYALVEHDSVKPTGSVGSKGVDACRSRHFFGFYTFLSLTPHFFWVILQSYPQ